MYTEAKILLTNANAKRIPLADNSVNCVVTSSPYYGLRSYLPDNHPNKSMEIGLEQSPEQFIQMMVNVGRELWRVLRNDGTFWLVIGDSYAGSGNGSNDYRDDGASISKNNGKYKGQKPITPKGYKPKDLMFIPARVAMALQADGWWVRNDNIWHKPNPMPESVKDRCTKAHEYIFLLTKSARYWYDNEAVKEDFADDRMGNPGGGGHYARTIPGQQPHRGGVGDGIWNVDGNHSGRNKRSVWTVTTKPYPGSHYAVFPPDLIEPCVLAGCPETVCSECGAPYERVQEVVSKPDRDNQEVRENRIGVIPGRDKACRMNSKDMESIVYADKGWQPTCTCDAGTKPGTVLDPFAGSGTTLMVARKHRRNAIGLDLNFEYLNTNARERLTYGDFIPVADGVNQLTIGV